MGSRKEMRKALIEITCCQKCDKFRTYSSWSDEWYLCGLVNKKIEKDYTNSELQEVINGLWDSTWINDFEIPEWCPRLIKEEIKEDIEWIAEVGNGKL